MHKLQAVWKHFKTVTYHKYLVAQGCFKVGLYRQGIFHDLSKYSPTEFMVGVNYYQGNRSPTDAEREAIGYSSAWLHHKGRNKHHFEYWLDYNKNARPGELVPVPMPDRYIAEMIMDRIAACKVYKGKEYTDQDAYAYFLKGKNMHAMHAYTAKVLEKYLKMLAEYGEERTFRAIRRNLVCKKDTVRQKGLFCRGGLSCKKNLVSKRSFGGTNNIQEPDLKFTKKFTRKTEKSNQSVKTGNNRRKLNIIQ